MSGDLICATQVLTHAHGLFSPLANGSSNELLSWSPGPVAHHPPPSNIHDVSTLLFDLWGLVNHNPCLTSSQDVHESQCTRLSPWGRQTACALLAPRLRPKGEFNSTQLYQKRYICRYILIGWRTSQCSLIYEPFGRCIASGRIQL